MPEVVLEHPEAVTQLHRDFVHAGSDVVEALTYYAHREKLRVIGREGDLEPINRQALAIAKAVADETGTLFAGDICNTNVYDPADPASHKPRCARCSRSRCSGPSTPASTSSSARRSRYAQEALIATDVIKKAGKVAVITLAMHQAEVTREDWSVADACKRHRGRRVRTWSGLNCIRGPKTMMPLLACDSRGHPARRWRRCRCPIARRRAQPSFQSLRDAQYSPPGERPFPIALDPFTCNRFEIADFGREALALGIRYLGVCCGAGPHHIRSLAESVGKHPPASRYSADMSKHAFLGSHERIKQVQKDYAGKL